MRRIANNVLQYLDRRLHVKLNGSRAVEGVLRGYDIFLNVVLDDAYEIYNGGKKQMGQCIIRGNSVVMLEVSQRQDRVMSTRLIVY